MATIKDNGGNSLNFNSIMVDGRRVSDEVVIDFDSSLGKRSRRFRYITRADVERALEDRNIV